MPLKTWTPYERLLAEDLNAAFAHATNHYLPGAVCGPGATVSMTTVGTGYELKCAAPVAGADPLGFWDSSTSRLVVPSGQAGLYLAVGSAYFQNQAATGEGEPRQLWLRGFTPDVWQSTVQSSGTTPQHATVVAVGPLGAAANVFLTGTPQEAAACNGIPRGLALVRLGLGWGAINTLLLEDLMETMRETEVEQRPELDTDAETKPVEPEAEPKPGVELPEDAEPEPAKVPA